MLKITVMYTPPTDVAAFEEHYLGVHVPLALAVPGLARVETSRGVASAMGEPALHRIAELYFEDEAALTTALSSPQMGAAGADAADLARRTGASVSFAVTELD